MARRAYSFEEVERALAAYVLAGDNGREANRALKAQGYPAPSHSTIASWATGEHSDRYVLLRNELAPRVAERIAADAEAIARRLASLENSTIDRLEDELPNVPAKDLPGALRNLSTAKALQVDKLSSPLRGRPTVIHATQDARELLDEIRRDLLTPIDGTAFDITPEALPAGGSA